MKKKTNGTCKTLMSSLKERSVNPTRKEEKQKSKPKGNQAMQFLRVHFKSKIL
jgi:hypothetical protein